MNKIIVGFIGASGSGKDTASDYLVNNYGFKKMSFADPLKKMVNTLLPFIVLSLKTISS